MEREWGLVLAGGGAKGSYHMGVWEALNKLGVNITSVTGTSIGSINGALFCQGDMERALMLWENISIDKIVDLTNLQSVGENLFDLKNITALIAEAYKNNGLTMQPLYELLQQVVDEEAIRNSPVDFGLVTCRVPDLTAVELFKREIPSGKLVDYLMASASLPGFKAKKIEDKTFVDGGVINNMPADMLLKKGYLNLITVDVGGIGIVKNIDKTAKNIISIKCDETIIGTMEFKKEFIEKSIKKGYYDTFKAFGRLAGNRYYFNIADYYAARGNYAPEILEGLEHAAHAFGIDPVKVYRVESLIQGVLEGYHRNVEQTKETEHFFENFARRKYADKLIVARLARIIKDKNLDFMANKIIMNVLGNNFSAASALAYFLEQ